MPAFRFALVLHTDGSPAPADEAAGLLLGARQPVGRLHWWSDGPLSLALAEPVNAGPDDPLPLCETPERLVAVVGELHPRVGSTASRVLGVAELAVRWPPATPFPPAEPLGDAAVLVWNRRARKLELARDAVGVVPVYWAHANGRLVCASELRAVAAHQAVPIAVNEGYLAEELVGERVSQTETAIAAIQRLRPGGRLAADPGGVRLSRWHELPDQLPDCRLTFDEAAELLREVVTDAVHRRVAVASQLGCDVSGGLDSSTVALLAEAAAPGGVVGVTIDSSDPRADERSYAGAVLERLSGNALRIDHLPPTLEFSLEQIERTGTPPGLRDDVDRAQVIRALAAHGVSHRLTGLGGDEYLGGNSLVARDQWWTGHPLRAVRSLHVPLRSAPGPVWSQLVRPVAVDVVPRRWRGRRRPPFPWLTPGFAARTQVWERVAPPRPPRRMVRPSWVTLWRIAADAPPARTFEEVHADGCIGGIAVRHPLHDRRVTELALRIPEHLRWSGSDRRALHRAAFGDLLPPEVASRRSKAEFSSVVLAHLEAYGGLPALRRSIPVAEGWVDPDALTELWRRTTAAREGLFPMIALASIDLWLRHGPIQRRPSAGGASTRGVVGLLPRVGQADTAQAATDESEPP